MMKHCFRLWILALFITSVISTANAEASLTKVRIASGGHIVHFLPLDVAQALGFFEEQGLDPKITYIKGGTATAQALISGQVDFSTNGIDHAFKSAVKGKDDLRMVVLMNQTPGMVLVAHSKYQNSINTITDLKGKKLGVTSKGSATNMVLAFLLSKNGLKQDDITVVKAGSSTFPAALKNNEIDGGIALEPFASMMVQQGDAFVLQRLISVDETAEAFGGLYNLAGILTRQEMIDRNPVLVQKVVDVLVRALRWIGGHTAEEIADVLPTEVIGSDKQRYIDTLKLLKDFYSKNGFISHEGAENVLYSMVQSGVLSTANKLDAKRYYSNEFVSSKNTKPEETSSREKHDEGSELKVNDENGSLTKLLLITLIPLFLGIAGTWWFSSRTNKEMRKQYEALKSEQKKLDFIDSLDEFAKTMLESVEGAQRTVKLSIPSPLLYSFQYERLGDSSFDDNSYKESKWYREFAAKFLEKVYRKSGKLDLTLVMLNDKQSEIYAKSLLKADKLAKTHCLIVKEFIKELGTKCNLKLETLYTIPYWSLVVDPHLDREGLAIVCFSDPDMVIKQKKSDSDNQEIAKELKGIHVTEVHAVRYFSDSFDDMQTRHYFHEVVEEIREQLTKHDIDMAFVKKWNEQIDNPFDWKPHKMLSKRKPS